MSQTTTREERRSALDEFASLPKQDTANLPAVVAKAPPPTLVHGPQPVARFRDEAQILIKLKTLAAAAADEWFYRFPVRDRKTNTTSYIEGASIKLANDLARIYGACDVDSWVSSEGPDYWEITARFLDLETGFSLTRPFRQRKNVARIGGSDDSRRDEIGFSIGISKAERNVVVNALQTFADFAFDEARNSLVDKIGRDLEGWRKKIVERLNGMVSLDRVEAVIGRTAKEWLAPDIARVAAMGKAIADGMASIDETFPPVRDRQAETAKADLDAFAGTASTGSAHPAPSGDDGRGEAEKASPGGGSSEASLTPRPSPAAAAPSSSAGDAIERILKLVGDKATSDAEKMESLELRQPAYEHLPEEFRTTLFSTAAKVVRKELTAAAAKKYLDQVGVESKP